MQRKIGLLFSGQGAQAVGMGKDLAAAQPVAEKLFRRADEVLGRPLSQIMFEGPEEELTRTANCQPALYVHGLACLAALRQQIPGLTPVAAAGLSLGEFTAHAAAGTFSFEEGLRLVAHRGEYMEEACRETEGGMAAMIGADENAVRDLASETDVDIANLNCPGQVVVSGESSKIALAVSLAKEHGVRVAKPLNVAGAYHSRLMESAYRKLDAELATLAFAAPKIPVVCNVDAIPVATPEEIRKSLADQVTGTVRWTESMIWMLDHAGCDLFLEFGPGGVLAGLLGRIRKGTDVLSISNPASLADAAGRLATML
jgi:[acyl-carrier-protein] S-malonyltransferase